MDNKVLSKSFLWMAIGLLVTFATGFVVANNPNMLFKIFSGGMQLILLIVELGLVIYLSSRVYKMSESKAKVMFLLYAFVSGLTFSINFIYYEIASVFYVFLIAAALFGLMAFIGHSTKIDLTKFGTYLFMALIGTIIASLINIFLGNSMLDLIITIIILIVFLGVTAYDVQKIKRLTNVPNGSIHGALDLYLDFINIFISLLRLFGNSRD
jgi:FtsH-binding integral membrane protein